MFAIIYHNNCADGFMSAYLMTKYVRTFNDKMPDLYPMNCGDPLPDIQGKYVFVLDFSFDEPTLDLLASNNLFVELLDHHETAFRKLSQLHQNNEDIAINEKVNITKGTSWAARLDNGHSGCGMVLEYIKEPTDYIFNVFPVLQNEKTFRSTIKEMALLYILNNDHLKLVCDAIEDRDLWRFKLPETEEICLMMGSIPKTINAYDEFLLPGNHDFSIKLQEARSNVRYMNGLAESAANKAKVIRFQGISIPCTNCTSLISLTNDKMKGNYGISMTYFITEKAELIVSLRADTEKGFNVAELANVYGGGGHKGSAGFKLPIDKLKDFLEGKL